jgi:hypothetical protein
LVLVYLLGRLVDRYTGTLPNVPQERSFLHKSQSEIASHARIRFSPACYKWNQSECNEISLVLLDSDLEHKNINPIHHRVAGDIRRHALGSGDSSATSRNFAVHLAEPKAVVKVAPPRGKGNSFASVRKDTWLGGVLDNHLSDKRSTMEQTIAMFQPWT